MDAPAVPETGRERNQAELHLCRLPRAGRRTLLAAFGGCAVARPATLARGPSPRTPTAGRRTLPADLGGCAVARPATLARGPSPRTPTAGRRTLPADLGGCAVARPATPARGPNPRTPTAGRRTLPAAFGGCAVARPATPARGRTPGPPRLRLTLAGRFTAAGHPGRPTKIDRVGTEEHDGQGYGHPGERQPTQQQRGRRSRQCGRTGSSAA